MQFTKVHQELAKPVYEVIPKIAERQEKECPRCNGYGYIIEPLAKNYVDSPKEICGKCSGTGKIKGKWEWEPKVGDTCFDHWHNEPMVIYAVEEDKQIVYASRFTATDESNGYRQDIKHLTPILEWERIREILEGMGYKVKVRDQEDFGEDCRYNCGIYTDKLGVGRSASTCQEAVQKAILSLIEELEAREGA